MIEVAIDRENPRADQLVSLRIDDPGRGNLGEAFDLLGNPLVQRFFLGTDLGIRQPGEQVVDARRDEDVRVEYLGRILFGDGNRLGERRRSGVVTRLVREIPPDCCQEERHYDCADQEDPQGPDRPKRRFVSRRRLFGSSDLASPELFGSCHVPH